MQVEELPDSAFYILLLLLEANHGYMVMKEVEELTDGVVAIGPASMYTTIKKLLNAGLIEQLEDAGEGRKIYFTTDLGKEMLKREVERKKKMVRHAEIALEKERKKHD
jgi:DNA-binding PadR family transcriptional regulator